ncbi:hypothetical protein Pcinc_043458 [Petrolisthes cinctipes]|uniref:Uncharacterized protein n=1 Tax=Petrolisthes cinctipes TaxID=88211 RepID=A0AAE1BGI1_PETCI|nr:hypothetical protein Pcinc_043458 [Petrolisthes cinctipes]
MTEKWDWILKEEEMKGNLDEEEMEEGVVGKVEEGGGRQGGEKGGRGRERGEAVKGEKQSLRRERRPTLQLLPRPPPEDDGRQIFTPLLHALSVEGTDYVTPTGSPIPSPYLTRTLHLYNYYSGLSSRYIKAHFIIEGVIDV